MLIDDYRTALQKIRSAPLSLTDADFSALDAINPADERRGRDAVRRAQLALLAMDPKAAPDQATVLADALASALRRALAPVLARLRALEAIVPSVRQP